MNIIKCQRSRPTRIFNRKSTSTIRKWKINKGFHILIRGFVHCRFIKFPSGVTGSGGGGSFLWRTASFILRIVRNNPGFGSGMFQLPPGTHPAPKYNTLPLLHLLGLLIDFCSRHNVINNTPITYSEGMTFVNIFSPVSNRHFLISKIEEIPQTTSNRILSDLLGRFHNNISHL